MGVYKVLVPPASAQLTSLAAARSMVDEGVLTQADDYILSNLIDRASAIVARYCGQVFGLRTISETFHLSWFGGGLSTQAIGPYGTPLTSDFSPLLLSQYPVTNIYSVVENGNSLDPASDYELDAGILNRMRNGLRAWWTPPTILVTYQAGYLLPNDDPSYTLPLEIEDVVLSLVQSGYYNRATNPNVTMELTEGVGRVMYNKTVGIGTMPIDASLMVALAPHVNRVW